MTWHKKPCWRPSAKDWGSPLHLPAKQAVLPFVERDSGFINCIPVNLQQWFGFPSHTVLSPVSSASGEQNTLVSPFLDRFLHFPSFCLYQGAPGPLLITGSPIQLGAKSTLSLFSDTLGTVPAFWDCYFMNWAGFLFWKAIWMSSNNKNTTRCLCNVL